MIVLSISRGRVGKQVVAQTRNAFVHIVTRAFVSACIALAFTSCGGAPRLDCADPDNKRACIDQVNIFLTDGDCGSAIDLADTMYATAGVTDNEVRLIRASAHACRAEVGFFTMIDSITSSTSSLSGAGFWTLTTQMFRPPSGTTDLTMDQRIESGWKAMEALFATMNAGVTVPLDYQINFTSINPGSMTAQHRGADPNMLGMLTAFSILGNVQNRFGDPDSNNNQVTAFPWQTKATISDTTQSAISGCEYAGAYIHLVDTIDAVTDSLQSDTLKNGLMTLSDVLRNGIGGVGGINSACDLGCRGRDALDLADVDNIDCAYASGDCNQCSAGDTTCIQCPVLLRNRTSCQTDVKSACAAAGIVRFAEAIW